jgi:uncharacterized protein
MTHVAHELAEEFPDKAEKIHSLKASDAHFARLVDDYHAVNRAVHRAETRIDTLDDSAEQALRHKRMHLKDEIFRKLSAG